MPQSKNIQSSYIYIKDISIHPQFKLDPNLDRNVLFYPLVLPGVASIFYMTMILILI